MIRTQVLIAVLVFATCSPVRADPPKTSPPAELKWAKGIVTDFWDAVFDHNIDQAVSLFSPELSQRTGKSEFVFIGYVGRLNAISLHFLSNNYEKSSLSFASEELAPDKSEVIFKGSLFKSDEGLHFDFTIRVAKEGAGRWSIRYIMLRDHKTDNRPGKK